MQPTSRFDAITLQLHALIADLSWRIQMLEADIREEESKARNTDPSSPGYPMLAQTMRTRRDNLRASVALLEARLPAGLSRAA
jgi:BMFP domain-containing protein YqiC